MAKLLVMLDGAVLRQISLSQERTTIGRRRVNDLVIDNLGVSGEHAVVFRRGEDFYLEDLGSTNGTLVNGGPVKEHLLQFGDSIEIGRYQLKFLADSGSATEGDIDYDTSQPLPHGFSNQAPSTVQIRPTGSLDDASANGWPTLRILSGTNAGRELQLMKSLTTLGRPGYQIAVVTRRPTGYFIAHLEGDVFPAVNGSSLCSAVRLLIANDIIEVAGVKMRFLDGRQSDAQGQHSEQPVEPTSPGRS